MERYQPDDRNAEFNKFAYDIIDGRQELERELKEKATGLSIILAGYNRDNLQLPTYLDLPHKNGGIPGTMNFEASTVDGETRLKRITIAPDDAAPLTVLDDHGIMIQESGDNTSQLPSSALNETLYSLFPENVRYKLTVEKALEVIGQLSPESSTIHEFKDESADFLSEICISNTETVNDSIFSLEIVKTIIHPSGLLLGTRMNLSESIQRQIAGVDVTRNSLYLDVHNNSSPIVEMSFMEMFEGRIVPVTHPTKRHIDDVMDAMMRLSECGFDTPNSGTA